MSAITDRARNFWDRISPRERNLVVLGGVALPVILAIWAITTIRDGLATIEHNNSRTRLALLAVEDMRARGESKPPVDDALAAMTTEPVPLPTYITNAAKKAKFELKSTITPHDAPAKGGFVTSSASLQVDRLDIAQLKDFLSALETDSKVVATTKLEIHTDMREKDKLRANLEVSTYSRDAKAAGSDSGSAGSASKASN